MSGDPAVTIHYNSKARGLARLPRHPLDWYIEPDWAVELLLRAEPFMGRIHDPAAGRGTVVRVARRMGLKATGSDLARRPAFADIVEGGVDFLDRGAFESIPNIVTNPPYQLAVRFIRQAWRVASRKIAVLVQNKFLYSQARHSLFTELPVSRLLFFSWRPSMPPGDELLAGEIKAKGGSADYLWIVIDKSHVGPPTATWLGPPPGWKAARRNGRQLTLDGVQDGDEWRVEPSSIPGAQVGPAAV